MDSLRLLLELTDEHVADLHGVSLVQLNVTRVMTLVSNTCRNQGRRRKLPTFWARIFAATMGTCLCCLRPTGPCLCTN